MASSLKALHHFSTIATLLLFLLLPLSSSSLSSPTTTPSYPNITCTFYSFTNPNDPNFDRAPNSSINGGALQITPDTRNNPSFLTHKSGRILLSQGFKLFESSQNSTHVASFSTSFKMNVFRDNDTVAGEGLAFLIAPSTDDPPPNSDGGYLGLTNSTIDGLPSNQFIAVEFDTVKQSSLNDPNANHVGLDINSVVSNITTDLTTFGIVIAPIPTEIYTVWIDYSGVTRLINVYMNKSADAKPATPVLSAALDLSAHLNQFSYFGFAASTGSNHELNCILQWNLTVEYLPTEGGRGWPKWKCAAAIVASIVLFLIIVFAVLRRYMMRRRVGDDPSTLKSTLKSLPGMPREFTYKELKRATGNFDEKMKLGQGGFGVVYKGVIPGENEVAVKKFSRGKGSSQNDFLKELTIINRLRHKHLVGLLGWCHNNDVLLLVYEFMPQGSLDQHIFAGADRPLLTWERRHKVIVGLASALHYLHHEFNENVIHRDLKASNVMLDAAFEARLGDFGLARAIPTDKTAYTELELGGCVAGTYGYIAPDYILNGKATRQSDVFGFGAVILEVACGRRPCCEVGGFKLLSDWVWKMYREGKILEAVDERLNGEFVHAEAERLLLLGLACSHPNPGDRPKMQEIVQVLTGTVSVPEVPPFKPKFVWSSEPSEEEEQSSTATSRLTSVGTSSSYYASSGAGTPQNLIYDI